MKSLHDSCGQADLNKVETWEGGFQYMITTVEPCFHWIGYHLCRHLLQEGDEVVGIDPVGTPMSEFLHMLVGRNSSFQHFYYIEDKEKHVQHANEERTIRYLDHEITIEYNLGEDRYSFQFKTPPLYGEWMDLKNINIETRTELYQWVKENQAIYIDDYLPHLLHQHSNKVADFHQKGEMNQTSIQKNVDSVWAANKKLISHTTEGFV